ncbi:PREDICTED: LOW QUALITY PROTEIN: cadherin-15 [Myotis davidii]|uniref:LOW QUALITY PROTEIN: cadherin-15 n=1 Tax=Myotis davidii TaxID=225400 RepID=UPI000766F165|nr:PREDICTED: LOW QUALITY PROTEIN: cadherin-15 [Myotis davidii]
MDTVLLFALGLLAQGLDLSLGVPGLRRPGTLFPWHRVPSSGRVRRAWVIPPISVSENYKRLPYPLVQIKSDKQQLGSVIYSIQGPGVDEEPRGVFSIDKFTGKVFLNALLDREKTDRFRLRAFALDRGGSTLEEPTDLEIVVVDQNDNRPVFRQEVFTGRVLEGAVPGTYVTRAEATDADDPETDNAALRYSILEQGSPQLFSIDEHTGEIRTVQVGLDREVVAVYNLTLQVADMSGDGLTSTASAIITLEDVNDNAPGFTREEFFMEATEAMSGVDVGRLEVEDRDLPGSPNWAARFTILEGDPDGHFAIRTDPKTNEGVLSVVKPLDYESCDQYDLRVEVQNEVPLQAAAPRAERDQARVSVQVRDVNEAPVFQENPLRTSLAERAAPGTPVATFSARDPDTQQLQRLSYSKDYDPEDWLQVDGATGWVQTQSVLSPASPFLKDGWYRAIILAYDDASPPCTATGTLSIEILEVNDHAPELSPSSGSLCSEPDQGSGLLLGATDEDLPPHGAPFHFQLSPRVPELARNWSLSRINMSHVRLRLRHQVQEGLHRLSLLLQDSGQPPQHREQLLNVTVCHCGQDGVCLQGAAALRAKGTGLSLGALGIVLASVILLFLLTLPAALLSRLRQQPWDKGLLPGLQDDLRDNTVQNVKLWPWASTQTPRVGASQILSPNPQTYCSQKGAWDGNPTLSWPQAQDHALCPQDAYDISQLRHPAELAALSAPLGRPLLRRDAPFSWVRPPPSRVLPTSPADMADFINDGLEAADSDLSVPPYDTALIYDYEGDGSMAGTLSSILSSLGDEDQDYSCLQDWGPRFARLADLYGPP